MYWKLSLPGTFNEVCGARERETVNITEVGAEPREEEHSFFRSSNHLPLSLRVHILALPFSAVFPLASCLASCNLSFLFCKMG